MECSTCEEKKALDELITVNPHYRDVKECKDCISIRTGDSFYPVMPPLPEIREKSHKKSLKDVFKWLLGY